jgi:hypothetical protein
MLSRRLVGIACCLILLLCSAVYVPLEYGFGWPSRFHVASTSNATSSHTFGPLRPLSAVSAQERNFTGPRSSSLKWETYKGQPEVITSAYLSKDRLTLVGYVARDSLGMFEVMVDGAAWFLRLRSHPQSSWAETALEKNRTFLCLWQGKLFANATLDIEPGSRYLAFRDRGSCSVIVRWTCPLSTWGIEGFSFGYRSDEVIVNMPLPPLTVVADHPRTVITVGTIVMQEFHPERVAEWVRFYVKHHRVERVVLYIVDLDMARFSGCKDAFLRAGQF